MRIIRAILWSGVALCALAGGALADDPSALSNLNIDDLSTSAAPVLPKGSELLAITKGAQPVVPGLPLSARDKAAFGDTATTLRVLPSADGSANGSISWSGYTRAGVVYHNSN